MSGREINKYITVEAASAYLQTCHMYYERIFVIRIHTFSQAPNAREREKKNTKACFSSQGHVNIFTIKFDSAVGHLQSCWLPSSPGAGWGRGKNDKKGTIKRKFPCKSVQHSQKHSTQNESDCSGEANWTNTAEGLNPIVPTLCELKRANYLFIWVGLCRFATIFFFFLQVLLRLEPQEKCS